MGQGRTATVLALTTLLASLTACEPVRFADLAVTPRHAPGADSTTHGDAFAIAARVASRYGLERFDSDDGDRLHVGSCSGSLRLDPLPEETSPAWRARTDSIIAALGPSLARPPVDPDSTVADTIAPPYRGPHDPRMMALVYGGWIVLFAAPAAFALMPMEDSGQAKRHANYLSAHAGIGYGEHERRGWSHVQSVEAFWNGLYAELRAESYHVPAYSGVQAARAGYLWRRRSTVAGGVTAGYVRGAGDNLPGGLEIGLPLLLQLQRGWMRFDATYVLTPDVGYYNWRTVMGLAFPRKPFAGGFSYDVRTPVRGDEPFAAPVLFVGMRF